MTDKNFWNHIRFNCIHFPVSNINLPDVFVVELELMSWLKSNSMNKELSIFINNLPIKKPWYDLVDENFIEFLEYNMKNLSNPNISFLESKIYKVRHTSSSESIIDYSGHNIQKLWEKHLIFEEFCFYVWKKEMSPL